MTAVVVVVAVIANVRRKVGTLIDIYGPEEGREKIRLFSQGEEIRDKGLQSLGRVALR